MVGFRNTVRARQIILGASTFWHDHHAVNGLDGVGHGVQPQHGGFREVARVAKQKFPQRH